MKLDKFLNFARIPTDEESRWTAAVAVAIGKERARLSKLEEWADPELVKRIAERGRFLRRKVA